jgi:hypothetical protein
LPIAARRRLGCRRSRSPRGRPSSGLPIRRATSLLFDLLRPRPLPPHRFQHPFAHITRDLRDRFGDLSHRVHGSGQLIELRLLKHRHLDLDLLHHGHRRRVNRLSGELPFELVDAPAQRHRVVLLRALRGFRDPLAQRLNVDRRRRGWLDTLLACLRRRGRIECAPATDVHST